MVTIRLQGGIGNQLFQIAALVAFAKRHRLEYALPTISENSHNSEPYIFPNLNYSPKELYFPLYTEPLYRYKPIPFMDNVCLAGYFQSERYFNDVIEDVGGLFGFEYKKEKGVCAVHVRRGDYLQKSDYHPFAGEIYFLLAMDKIAEKTGVRKFRVFSEDIAWCKKTFEKSVSYEIEYMEGGIEIEDLVQGSWCEHQIMSNSAFSVWQHLLNKNKDKVCIAPKKWFGSAVTHDTRDVYPRNCIIL